MTEQNCKRAFISSIHTQHIDPGHNRAIRIGLHHNTLVGQSRRLVPMWTGARPRVELQVRAFASAC